MDIVLHLHDIEFDVTLSKNNLESETIENFAYCSRKTLHPNVSKYSVEKTTDWKTNSIPA